MTEEIKEILDYIDDRIIPNEKWDKIKDYITNLQQQKSDICKNRLAIAIERDRLQQENETLKEKINTLKSNFETEIDDCEDYKKWYRDYKSRCEKAIEYIKNLSNKPNVFGHYGIDTRCKKWLLKILKGSVEK